MTSYFSHYFEKVIDTTFLTALFPVNLIDSEEGKKKLQFDPEDSGGLDPGDSGGLQ